MRGRTNMPRQGIAIWARLVIVGAANVTICATTWRFASTRSICVLLQARHAVRQTHGCKTSTGLIDWANNCLVLSIPTKQCQDEATYPGLNFVLGWRSLRAFRRHRSVAAHACFVADDVRSSFTQEICLRPGFLSSSSRRQRSSSVDLRSRPQPPAMFGTYSDGRPSCGFAYLPHAL